MEKKTGCKTFHRTNFIFALINHDNKKNEKEIKLPPLLHRACPTAKGGVCVQTMLMLHTVPFRAM